MSNRLVALRKRQFSVAEKIGIYFSLYFGGSATLGLPINHYYPQFSYEIQVSLSLALALIFPLAAFLFGKGFRLFVKWRFADEEETVRILYAAKRLNEKIFSNDDVPESAIEKGRRISDLSDCVRAYCKKNRFAVKPLVRSFFMPLPLKDELLTEIYDHYYGKEYHRDGREKPISERDHTGIVTDFSVETHIEEAGWQTLRYKTTVLQTMDEQKMLVQVCDAVPNSLSFQIDGSKVDFDKDVFDVSDRMKDFESVQKEKPAQLDGIDTPEKGSYFQFNAKKGLLKTYTIHVRCRLPLFEEKSGDHVVQKIFLPFVDGVLGGHIKVSTNNSVIIGDNWKFWKNKTENDGTSIKYILAGREECYVKKQSDSELFFRRKYKSDERLSNIRITRDPKNPCYLEIELSKRDQSSFASNPIFTKETHKKWGSQFSSTTTN